MANKAKRGVSRKERTENLIQKWAFGILFALVIEFLVYIVILNLVPTMTKTKIENDTLREELYYNPGVALKDAKDEAALVNPFYRTDRNYVSWGYFSNDVTNPTWWMYYYQMVLLSISIVLVLYYLVVKMENNDLKVLDFIKKEWPFAILLCFMVWVFLSSCLAQDSYRSFVGCNNLKDGYLSFMMYGMMLVCSMLIVRKNESYKRIIVNTFLITATIITILSIWNYHFVVSRGYISGKDSGAFQRYAYYCDKYKNSEYKGWISTNLITYAKNPSDAAYTIGELLFGNGGLERGGSFLIVTKRFLGEEHSGIFHNSNHYGYYLSISVIVAAVMALKERKVWKKLLYFISYLIMLYMVILNNTLGAYIGVGVSVMMMFIYALIPKFDFHGDDVLIHKKAYFVEAIVGALILISFVIFSATVTNRNGDNIVYANYKGLSNDLQLLFSGADKNASQTETKTESGTKTETATKSGSSTTTNSSNNSIAEIGSGRGKLWYYGMVLAAERPLFGYGLENIIYEYDRFKINEGRSHNLIVQLSATTGFVGMLLYVVGIASLWIRKLKYIKTWDVYECLGMFVIVSYIISSVFGNSGFYSSPYFYIFVGFVILSRKQTEK